MFPGVELSCCQAPSKYDVSIIKGPKRSKHNAQVNLCTTVQKTLLNTSLIEVNNELITSLCCACIQVIPAASRSKQEEPAAGPSGAGNDVPELRIAWQYRKYIANASNDSDLKDNVSRSRSGADAAAGPGSTANKQASSSSVSSAPKAVQAGLSREWCHKFDLTRPMGEAALAKSGMQVLQFQGTDALTNSAKAATTFISEFVPQKTASGVPLPSNKGPEGVGRLAIQSLSGTSWLNGLACKPAEDVAAFIFNMVLCIRRSVQGSRCSVMVTVPATCFPPSFAVRLQHLCDTVMVLQTITDASEVFKLLPDSTSAAALLSITKLASTSLAVTRMPDLNLYVIRNKRKRLAITMVDIDPDAEQENNDSSASKPASSVLCSGPSNTKPDISF